MIDTRLHEEFAELDGVLLVPASYEWKATVLLMVIRFVTWDLDLALAMNVLTIVTDFSSCKALLFFID